MTAALPVRWPLLASGVLLLLQAVRLRHRPSPSASHHACPTGPTPRLLARLAARLARILVALRGPADATVQATIAGHLAAAPGCWPARWVSAAAVADGSGSLSLADLLRGVQAMLGVSLSLAAVAVLLPVLGPAAAVPAGCAAIAGCATCRLALARAAQTANEAARDDIAGCLDLVAASTAAGLPGPAALRHAAAHAAPPLAAALRRVSARRETGIPSAAAWSVEARDLRMPAFADVAEAVERHETTGAPLSAELRRIAARSRSEGRAELTEKAARRGPLATVLVAVVIAPLCVATLVACLVGGLLQGGSPALH